MSDRQRKEYLREDREAVECSSPREEREWVELEKKLKPKTRGEKQCITIECKRKWFRNEFDYLADDESVCIAWDKKEK